MDAAALLRLTSRRKVRRAHRAGLVVREGRGTYAVPTAAEARRVAVGLSAVISHASAAARHGWKTKAPPPVPTVTVPRKRRVDVAGGHNDRQLAARRAG